MKKHNLMMFAAGSILAVAALAGCNGNNKIKIGILQPAEHKALSAARAGFIESLAANGYGEDKVEFIYRNAGGNAADIVAYAKDLVGRCNMTFGIGTGASQQLRSSAIDKGNTNPILFSAVTDPVGAGLVTSLKNGSGFITGTSDYFPELVATQVNLVQQCIPNADKVGIIYTQGETNSVAQANEAKAALEKVGIEVIIKTATGPTDISSTASALAAVDGLDAIFVPTDNNIAANPASIKSAVQGKGILVVAGEEDMLAECGSITLSIDYKKLGKMTGDMAVTILKGEKKPGELPVGTMTKEECEYIYSSANATAAGVTIPDALKAMCRDISK